MRIRCASSLALFAFLVSAKNTSDLQGLILSACQVGIDNEIIQYSVAGSALMVSRANEYAVYQHSWDAPGVAHEELHVKGFSRQAGSSQIDRFESLTKQ